MTEREMVVQYLMGLAASDPPPEIVTRNQKHFTPEAIQLCKAGIEAAAQQIAAGMHEKFNDELNG